MTIKMLISTALMMQLLAVPACAQPPVARTGALVPVRLPSGAMLQAEVARTPEQRERGLMFREELPEDRAMLFVFEQDSRQVFWMKNTWIDLDIVFLGPDRVVRSIFQYVPRTSAATPQEQIPMVEAAGRYVLELPAGTARRYELKAGDVVEFQIKP